MISVYSKLCNLKLQPYPLFHTGQGLLAAVGSCLAVHQMITFTWFGAFMCEQMCFFVTDLLSNNLNPIAFLRSRGSWDLEGALPQLWLSTLLHAKSWHRVQLNTSDIRKTAKLQKYSFITWQPNFPWLYYFWQSDAVICSNLVNGTGQCLRKEASTVMLSLHWLSAGAITEILIHSHWRKNLKNNWIFHEANK